ncbi:MAG: EamA family transporter [Alphaproteobacteria bacterium]
MPVLICIVSAFFWAAFDLTRKLTLEKISSINLLLIFTITQLIIFFIWLFFEDFSINLIPYLLPGITLIIIGLFSALLFLKAIKQSDLSLTIPLLSLSPMFSSLFSFFFLNEQLSNIQYLGIFLIILGTLILYSKKLTIYEIIKSFKIILKNSSAKLMVLVSIIWSLTPVLDKICLKNSSVNIHGFIQSLGMITLLIFLFKKDKVQTENTKKNWRIILLTVFIGSTATILQFYAILTNYVPIMESIKRSIGQLSSVFLGKIFFNEEVNKPKVVGVIVLSIGVYFILGNEVII